MAEAALSGVTKRFGATEAVSDLTLTVADGEFIVLLGPTGAGKTTTLRLFAGLETPDSGRVEIGKRDVTALDPARHACDVCAASQRQAGDLRRSAEPA